MRHLRAAALVAILVVVLLIPWPSGAAGGLRSIGLEFDDPSKIPGAQKVDEGWAVPLKAKTPSWYTPELHQEVLTKGVAALPVDAPLPGEVGIRPGSWMISPYWCTMNFVFQKSTTLAIGTAGHCTDKTGEPVILLTVAPGGANPVLVDIGTVAVRRNNGIGDDFALVTIRPHLYPWVFPTIAGVGGPCGAYTGDGLVSVPNPVKFQGELIPSTFKLGDTVFHYGHGVGVGTGGTPRSGAALSWYPSSYTWAGVLYGGDSGSAVRIHDLKAAGNLTHGLGIGGVVPLPVGYGTRISKMLSIAKGYSLVNSPLCV
jgi:hypothetical protein